MILINNNSDYLKKARNYGQITGYGHRIYYNGLFRVNGFFNPFPANHCQPRLEWLGFVGRNSFRRFFKTAQ